LARKESAIDQRFPDGYRNFLRFIAPCPPAEGDMGTFPRYEASLLAASPIAATDSLASPVGLRSRRSPSGAGVG
jgi:hypothetical protein